MIQQFIEATFSLVGDGTSTSFDIALASFGIVPSNVIAVTVDAPVDSAPICTATLGSTALTLTFSTALLAPASGSSNVYVVHVQYTS